MKIINRPICKVLELKDYDPRMEPGEVFIWVNPQREFLRRRDVFMRDFSRAPEINDEKSLDMNLERLEIFNLQMLDWYAELWSKGENAESHWTADEVRELSDADPACFSWLVSNSTRLMSEHRKGEKKN